MRPRFGSCRAWKAAPRPARPDRRSIPRFGMCCWKRELRSGCRRRQPPVGRDEGGTLRTLTAYRDPNPQRRFRERSEASSPYRPQEVAPLISLVFGVLNLTQNTHRSDSRVPTSLVQLFQPCAVFGSHKCFVHAPFLLSIRSIISSTCCQHSGPIPRSIDSGSPSTFLQQAQTI
jgi:hypothetical protein